MEAKRPTTSSGLLFPSLFGKFFTKDHISVVTPAKSVELALEALLLAIVVNVFGLIFSGGASEGAT